MMTDPKYKVAIARNRPTNIGYTLQFQEENTGAKKGILSIMVGGSEDDPG